VSRPVRVGVGGIRYESNSFAGPAAPRDCFTSHAILRDKEVIASAQPNSELTGAIEVAVADGAVELVGLIDTFGGCGAPIPDDVYVQLREELVARLLANSDLDAVYLPLHGAMTTTERDDADSDLLARVRHVVGTEVPVVVSFDLHAAVSTSTAQQADAVVGFKTCPHIDYVDTGKRALSIAIAAARGDMSPAVLRISVPMLTAAEAHDTNVGPLARHMTQLQNLVAEHSLLDGSIFACQPWLDTARSTWTITLTYDRHSPTGRASAQVVAAQTRTELLDDIEAFRMTKTATKDVWAAIESCPSAPVLVADSGDSPSAGAPGDSVDCLRALIVHARSPVLATLTDPDAARRAVAAGVGATLHLSLGGTLTPGLDRRIQADATVLSVSNGRYVQEYPAARVDVGQCAVVRVSNTDLALTSRPAFMLDTSLFGHLGLDPKGYSAVQVKSAGGFRALWSDISTEAVVVDSLGASTSRLTDLPFTKLIKPLWPFTESDPPDGDLE